ncbi:MAG: hypothetical protein CMJ18_27970 [Phycisphaeraceae bacterium]|nr:hypothetical protein [Phycisphaeraceae bacterium]
MPSNDDLPPLCVDLDGTLITTDSAFESMLQVLRRRPWMLLATPWWLRRGRAHLKRRLAENGMADPALLPYHEPVVSFVRNEKAKGRRVILATGSDEMVAGPIAEHVGLFDEVIASDGHTNRTGSDKVEAIGARLGDGPYDYIGNSTTDLPIWADARDALVVLASERVRRRLEAIKTPSRVFPVDSNRPRDLWRSVRPSRWIRNLLLFVPLLPAYRAVEIADWPPALVLIAGFIAFCACASAGYLFNDLVDVEPDRRHATRKQRPLAAGRVQSPALVAIGIVLVLAGLALGGLVGGAFALTLLAYLLLSTLYSMIGRASAPLQAVLLGALAMARVLAGAIMVDVAPSGWLLGFWSLLLLSLACAGIVGEARQSRSTVRPAAVHAIGLAAALASVAVLVAHLVGAPAPGLPRPWLFWFLVPLLVLWLARTLQRAMRGMLGGDPIVGSVRDPLSWAAAVAAALALALATGG